MATIQGMIGVLGDFYDMFREDEDFADMFQTFDIGFPLAWLTWKGAALPSELGEVAIRETWLGFCEHVATDPEGEFESFTQMREALDLLPDF